MLSRKFDAKWRKVTPRPSAIAGRYICCAKLPGRLTTLTVTVPLPSAAMGSLLLAKLFGLRPQDDERRRNDVRDRHWQQALPAEPHELIRAEARQRPPDEELERAEGEDLDEPDRGHRAHERDVREVREHPPVGVAAEVPAAEEDADHDGARGDDLEELAQEEHAEAQARILDEVADDLGLTLWDVEGRALRLGDGRGQEEDEPEGLREDAQLCERLFESKKN